MNDFVPCFPRKSKMYFPAVNFLLLNEMYFSFRIPFATFCPLRLRIS